MRPAGRAACRAQKLCHRVGRLGSPAALPVGPALHLVPCFVCELLPLCCYFQRTVVKGQGRGMLQASARIYAGERKGMWQTSVGLGWRGIPWSGQRRRVEAAGLSCCNIRANRRRGESAGAQLYYNKLQKGLANRRGAGKGWAPRARSRGWQPAGGCAGVVRASGVWQVVDLHWGGLLISKNHLVQRGVLLICWPRLGGAVTAAGSCQRVAAKPTLSGWGAFI